MGFGRRVYLSTPVVQSISILLSFLGSLPNLVPRRRDLLICFLPL